MGTTFESSVIPPKCAALTQKLRRVIDEGIGYGLALEGISAADAARRAAAKG
jgi:hypothetical protein